MQSNTLYGEMGMFHERHPSPVTAIVRVGSAIFLRTAARIFAGQTVSLSYCRRLDFGMLVNVCCWILCVR
jgi:hypothetical protein